MATHDPTTTPISAETPIAPPQGPMPETPEGAALVLLNLCLGAAADRRREILDLYAECLRTANNQRDPAARSWLQ